MSRPTERECYVAAGPHWSLALANYWAVKAVVTPEELAIIVANRHQFIAWCKALSTEAAS